MGCESLGRISLVQPARSLLVSRSKNVEKKKKNWNISKNLKNGEIRTGENWENSEIEKNEEG